MITCMLHFRESYPESCPRIIPAGHTTNHTHTVNKGGRNIPRNIPPKHTSETYPRNIPPKHTSETYLESYPLMQHVLLGTEFSERANNKTSKSHQHSNRRCVCYQHSTSCFDLYLFVFTLCRISRMYGRPGSCWTWWFCSSPSCDHAWHDCYVLLWRQSISTRRPGISEHQKLRSTKLITNFKVFFREIILSVMNNIWWNFS